MKNFSLLMTIFVCLVFIGCSDNVQASGSTLVGAYILKNIPSAPLETKLIEFNVEHANSADCTANETKLDHSAFSQVPLSGQGGASEGDIQKFVFTQCLDTPVVFDSNFVPTRLVGGIMFTHIPGMNTNTEILNINVKHYSVASCNTSKNLLIAKQLTPKASITGGASSKGDIRKYVILECLPDTAILQ